LREKSFRSVCPAPVGEYLGSQSLRTDLPAQFGKNHFTSDITGDNHVDVADARFEVPELTARKDLNRDFMDTMGFRGNTVRYRNGNPRSWTLRREYRM